MKAYGVFVPKPIRRIKGSRRTGKSERRYRSILVASCRRQPSLDRRSPHADRRSGLQTESTELTATTGAERFYASTTNAARLGSYVNVAV